MHLVKIVCAAGATAAAAALVIAAPGSSQTPATSTLQIRELEKGTTHAFVDQPPRSKRRGEPSSSLGDELVFTNPLVDGGGARVGRLYMKCAVLVAARRVSRSRFLCDGEYVLQQGTLTIHGLTSPGSMSSAAVTGGTGIYAGARGTVSSTSRANGDSDDTITYAL